MRTMSLRRRVVGAGAAVVVVVLVGVDIFVYLSMRDHLFDNLERVLDDRAVLARAFAPTFTSEELARLAGSEISVSVRHPDGSEFRGTPDDSPVPRRPRPAVTRSQFTRLVSLPDGGTVELVASRQGVDETLRRVLVSEGIGTALGLGLAVVLLRRASRVALQPVDAVVATARHIQGGRTGERLRPDRVDTELGRMAAAFDEMLDGLEAALADARASNEAGKRFLAEAAHQLRTPIAGIQASVEALPAAHRPADREELLASVARESARAGRRVAALLRMARLDQGTDAARRPSDVVALCLEEVERVAAFASGLTVTYQADQASLIAEIDPDGAREALANVLDNARRHATSLISVTLSTHDEVTVRVEDDGPGIPAADTERVFERFVSLDGEGGSGLGLTIARGIIRSHGGDIHYHDGAFVIRIPHPARSPRPPAEGHHRPGARGWSAARPQRIPDGADRAPHEPFRGGPDRQP